MVLAEHFLRNGPLHWQANNIPESVRGAKMGELQEKTPGTPASRSWHVSYVPPVGLEPTPDTPVR